MFMDIYLMGLVVHDEMSKKRTQENKKKIIHEKINWEMKLNGSKKRSVFNTNNSNSTVKEGVYLGTFIALHLAVSHRII